MTPEAKRLQALLFVAGEAVPMKELARVLGVSSEQLSPLLTELAHELTGQGVSLVTSGNEAELTTSPAVGEWLTAVSQPEPAELSRAAVETLAVMAYAGPLTRFEMDTIRGVDSRQVLRRLLGQGVIKRMPARGRVPQYDITEEFLKHVGITRRQDLPEFQDITSRPTLVDFLKQN